MELAFCFGIQLILVENIATINNYFLTLKEHLKDQICLYYNIFLNYLVFVEDDDGGDDKYHNDDNCH